MTAQEQMLAAIQHLMVKHDITQAELARRTGRTTKHVNQVLQGKAGSMELDYWLFCLGYRFNVTIECISNPQGNQVSEGGRS